MKLPGEILFACMIALIFRVIPLIIWPLLFLRWLIYYA